MFGVSFVDGCGGLGCGSGRGFRKVFVMIGAAENAGPEFFPTRGAFPFSLTEVVNRVAAAFFPAIIHLQKRVLALRGAECPPSGAGPVSPGSPVRRTGPRAYWICRPCPTGEFRTR